MGSGARFAAPLGSEMLPSSNNDSISKSKAAQQVELATPLQGVSLALTPGIFSSTGKGLKQLRASGPGKLPARRSNSRDFYVRTPARFLKDSGLSADAKLLRVLIGAFADGRNGRAYVTGRRLERLMGCGRGRRERTAVREPIAASTIAPLVATQQAKAPRVHGAQGSELEKARAERTRKD